jgi:hypothetical protein
VPVKPLAILFRAKLQAALRQTALYAHIAPSTWQQAWVVDCRPVGNGAAALKYLAPYIFRVALSNNRIVSVQDEQVTFRYRDGDTKQMRTCTLSALAFLQRFLQHVLPKGFVKVRRYGLFSRRQQAVLARLHQHLASVATSVTVAPPRATIPARVTPPVVCCPVCGQPMQATRIARACSRGPPHPSHRYTELATPEGVT